MRPELRLTALAALAAVALPVSAFGETLTVTGITATGVGSFELSVPTVEATDANLDETAIRALFDTTGADYAASISRLSELDAASIRIPEIIFSYDIPDGTAPGGVTRAIITYRDLEMTNVTDGVAAGATLGAVEVKSAVDTVVTMGKMTASLFDLGGILGFYGLDVSASPDAGMTPLYRDFSAEGGSVAGPGVSCTIGGARADEFSARPLKGTFADLMLLTAEIEAAEKTSDVLPPDVIAKALAFYADFLTAFQSTPMTFDGFDCSAVDPEGNGTIAVRTGAFTVGGFEPGIYPEFAFNDLAIEHSAEGSVHLGNFTWKRMDLNKPIAAILEVGAALNEAWFDANWRKLIPEIDGFSLADFSIDVIDESNPGNRIVASVGSVDLTLDDYLNGIPASISSTGTDLSFKFPDDPSGPPFAALGLAEPSIDYDVALQWNPEAKTINVDKLGFNIDDFGGISITGVIANAGPEVFAEDMQVATVAAMGLTVTELNIEIDNKGLVPALIAMAAREQNQPPALIAATMNVAARTLPIAMLGGTDEAKNLAAALGAFLSGTPQLSITLTSIDPKGIGLAELMAAETDPSTLKGKVAIAATATGEPVPFVYPDLPTPVPTTTTTTEMPADTQAPAGDIQAVPQPETPASDGTEPGMQTPPAEPAHQSQANPRTGQTPMN